MALNIIKNYLKNNRCYQQAKKRTPIGIQLHTIGTGQGTAQAVADYWDQAAMSACVHYIVDCDTPGKVLATLPEDYYAWADKGYGNRNLITFEICESDYIKYKAGTATYTVTDQVKFEADILRGYNTAVLLCADICKRYGWSPVDKLPSGLYLISSHDEGRRAGLSSAHVDPTHVWNRFGLTMDGFRKDVALAMTGEMPAQPATEPVYRVRKAWTDVTSQLFAGTLEGAKNACPAGYKVYDPDGKVVYENTEAITGTQTAEFANLSEADAAAKLLEICRQIADKYGLLPSVCAAQTILESGYCKTELAQKANNVCGMKCTLSGNSWPGSTWDGVSRVRIRTAEQDAKGNTYYIYADFRKYPNIEDSIADRCAYLLGAKNGEKIRYDGITSAADYVDQIKLIKNGGYATDVNYVSKICNIIDRFDLYRYDSKKDTSGGAPADILPETDKPWYRVRKTWADSKSQIGAYHDLDKAKECANKNWQYNVYDEAGNCVYSGPQALVDRAVDYMIGIANDDTHGYTNGKWGPEYSCLSLVETGYINAGMAITKSNIDKMPDNLIKAGFEDCTAEVSLKTGGGLAKGDILWMLDSTGKHGHVECYIGDGKLVGARGDTDGKPGDSKGDEISVISYRDMGWQRAFRLPGVPSGEKTGASEGTGNTSNAIYRVQVGAYNSQANAKNALKKVRAAGYPDAFLRHEDGMYKIQAWAGSRSGAEKVAADLKKKGISAIIK